MAAAPAFRIVSQDAGPRFLGLTVAERNARVARRAISAAPPVLDFGSSPTLTIPPGVVITPALIDALPALPGIHHLVWDPVRAPIIWSAGDPSSAGPPVASAVPDGAALDVATRAARRASAWRLLRASGKPTDGWLSRHIHRKISRLFSFMLLGIGLTPDAATFLTLLVGLVSAWLFAQTSQQTMIAGALVFWFASIADGIDGEMARLTLRESARGEQLDTVVDLATYVAGYAGLMVGCWRQGTGLAGWSVAGGIAIGIPLVLVWGDRLMRRARGARANVFLHKPIEFGVVDAAATTGAPALRVASGMFTLFRRESFSLAFVVVSLLTGRRIVIPALLAGGVLGVTATLIAYRDPIERAMRARYAAAP